MMRARASASATREVSMVIQRRPHCSATYAVVPEPQVGSRTRSPGSVHISKHRCITLGAVCTTYSFAIPLPVAVSCHKFVKYEQGKSSKYRMLARELPWTAT